MRPMALSDVVPSVTCCANMAWKKQLTYCGMHVPGGRSERSPFPLTVHKCEPTLVQNPKTGQWFVRNQDRTFKSRDDQQAWLKEHGKVLTADLYDDGADKNGSRHTTLGGIKAPVSEAAMDQHPVEYINSTEVVVDSEVPLSPKEEALVSDMMAHNPA